MTMRDIDFLQAPEEQHDPEMAAFEVLLSLTGCRIIQTSVWSAFAQLSDITAPYLLTGRLPDMRRRSESGLDGYLLAKYLLSAFFVHNVAGMQSQGIATPHLVAVGLATVTQQTES